MDKTTVTHALRISLSGGSLLLCVLVSALWPRSFTVQDTIYWGAISGREFYTHSVLGRVMVGSSLLGKRKPPPFDIFSSSVEPIDRDSFYREGGRSGLNFLPEQSTWTVSLPHAVVAALFATAGAFPWIRWRYSLRTLLIATTLVAVILGAVIIVAR